MKSIETPILPQEKVEESPTNVQDIAEMIQKKIHLVVIFDFDSTLADRESDDDLVAQKASPAIAQKWETLTNNGMDPNHPLDQVDSRKQRHELFAPLEHQYQEYGRENKDIFSDEKRKLIEDLRAAGAHPIIASGGTKPLIEELCIDTFPREDVYANPFGTETPIKKTDLVRQALKEKGLENIYTIAVGDGVSDYELLKEGVVDDFVGFEMHAKRGLKQFTENITDNVANLRSYLFAKLQILEATARK